MAGREASPRPDLEAFDRATRLPFRFVVKELTDLVGVKLVAYIASVTEARAVNEWATESREPKDPTVPDRLRLALRLAKFIAQHDNPRVAQAWFQGLNPQLGDRSAARLLREGDIAEVGPEIVAAARAFVVGG
jgi:hypothetical protein